MNTVSVELSLDQLKQALRRLPPGEKIALWRLLDEDIDRTAIVRRFGASLKAIRKAYASTSEDKIMADAVKATRTLRHAKNRS